MLHQSKTITLKNQIEVQLRSPNPSEAQLFLDHLYRSFSESYRNMNRSPEHWKKMSVKEEQKILQNFADAPDKFMLSAFYQGEVVGNIMIAAAASEFQRKNGQLGMEVEKRFHNTGLGSALMERAIAEARTMGLHRLELAVRTFNEAGIRLYEKFGFQRVGKFTEVAFIDGQYYDEYFYELLL